MKPRGYVAAGAAMLVLYAAGNKSGAIPPGPAATTASATVPAAGTLTCTGLEHLWEAEGGSPGAAFMAAEIATAESSGQQYAADHNTDGSVDRGYWQINSTHGSLSTFSPAGNARAAIELSGDGTNWSPWVTYETGAYAGKC